MTPLDRSAAQQSAPGATSDYYDPFPRMSLSRPILIAGQLGSRTRLIGRSFCARTGLPFVDIDRKIEHEAGRSLIEIAGVEGPARVANWARFMLDRFARERPRSVIVLDRAWPAIDSKQQLADRVDFVHVLLPRDVLFELMREELYGPASWLLYKEPEERRDPDRWHEYFDTWLSRRTPLLDYASILLEADQLHPHDVAKLLMDSLDSIADTHEV